VLIGAWEVLIGADAGCAVYQLRQFDNLSAWEAHQNRVGQDERLSGRRESRLYPYNDFVDTAIIRMADGVAPLPSTWPSVEEVRGKPRGYLEQRTLYLRPDTAREHHEFYLSLLASTLEREGAELVGLFDTLIGPGTTNAGSHRSIELRSFPDLSSWQRWRKAQDMDPDFRRLVKEDWLSRIERVESVLLRPMDYSRIR
jgi:hypothetical protein